jgi:hypothetical protein
MRNLVLFIGLGAGLVLGCTARDKASEEPVVYAVVNGLEIKSTDVIPKIQADLAELERNAYELRRRATEELIQQRLLEDEAKRQGVPVERLMSQFDDLAQKEVSPEEYQAFIKARNLDEKKLQKDERQVIPQMIRMGRVYQARQQFAADLRAKANIKIKVPRPPDRIAEVGVGNQDL